MLINSHIFRNHLLEVLLSWVCVCEYVNTDCVLKEENKRVYWGLLKAGSFVFNCCLISSLELHCILN